MILLDLYHQATSLLSSILRLGSGAKLRGAASPPVQTLILYEFEGCPFCRKVREALTDLAIDVEIRPTPKGGQRFRPTVVEQGGKAQFPYLVDPNSGLQIYESDAIIRHLFSRYGKRSRPLLLCLGPLTDLMLQLAMIPRLGCGVRVQASTAAAQPLELHGYEASPGTRLVRELLCSLELPYRMHHSTGHGAHSANSVPRLRDPNTGSTSENAVDALAYLRGQYAA